jgi:nucleoside-diphosphate-sugar epimerase
VKLLITGATGLTGSLLLKRLAEINPGTEVNCSIRSNSDLSLIENLNLQLTYHIGDVTDRQTWETILAKDVPETIVHIASIRYIEPIVDSLQAIEATPRLIVIGTTGIYSQYNEYSDIYQRMERKLKQYRGSYCLLRPTMIYGSYFDKNIHKLIEFCHKYGFFFVFGSGNSLLQPIHADDIAQALLSILQHPHIEGDYDISGGSIVTFRELLALVAKKLGKPIRLFCFPLNLGVFAASCLEIILGNRTPVTKEQILRLQEDKAYPYDLAKKDFNFQPRSLEVGLEQEIELMRQKRLI